jgi:hypothetical protein
LDKRYEGIQFSDSDNFQQMAAKIKEWVFVEFLLV